MIRVVPEYRSLELQSELFIQLTQLPRQSRSTQLDYFRLKAICLCGQSRCIFYAHA